MRNGDAKRCRCWALNWLELDAGIRPWSYVVGKQVREYFLGGYGLFCCKNSEGQYKFRQNGYNGGV